MLDIHWIREHAEEVQLVADQKKINVSVRELLDWDERKRQLLRETEALRAANHEASRSVRLLLEQGKDEEARGITHQVKQLKLTLADKEAELQHAEQQFQGLMLLMPNRVSEDTPVGRSDADNVEIKRAGTVPAFEYGGRDHVSLGEMHDILDMARGVKVAGTRSYVLKGAGVTLHRAVQQLALDELMKRGYTPLEVPLMVRRDALQHTGFFPLGQDQIYELEKEKRWLVGTSEVPLISCFSGEILDLKEPMRLAAATTCFRSEVGSAGKDVRGLYRVHQFAKVEQVILCQNDAELSEQLLQELTQNAEHILELLELPYRVMAVCTGDMSQKTYKQYDIETWMPSRQAYGETHSSSLLLDFQARRAHIRYWNADGKPVYCHTLNNTAVATPRILIPLLENHQQEDGSIRIPEALRPYMGGAKMLAQGALI
ncbi:serine--tRNA ligase [Paenibacillus rigui]|uniref:Serine--tRNA ligase n=1 Tax=Paenibacillus rigui TaxID=554312 RepID=A0A229UQT4_9BACL|nr:serine--tRNA ligase [Paenibacillus rigui]OXM85545.1 serine--tRNA ligase [Paenibacillus rigui]